MGRRRLRAYADRAEAGQVLARSLRGHAGRAGLVVLGLPRGGVPVAAAVAASLGAPLDVLVVRKLGVPGRPELAMGALAGVGGEVVVVRNEALLARARVPAEAFEAVLRAEVAELRRREQAYRAGRPAVAVRGLEVVLVDDGLATGATMRAAVASVRRGGPARVTAAVPVGSAAARAELEPDVDEVVCPWIPEPFLAVGAAYRNFAATSDGEVRAALASGGGTGGIP
jgi:predicted phosphoribosyltransferase